MSFVKPKFSHEKNAEFFTTLKKRVNQYFQQNNVPTTGEKRMYPKTIFMFTLYLLPYFILVFAGIESTWAIVGLWILMGFGMAGIGLSIMHDANHGVYSKNKKLNNLMSYTMNLIGSNAYVWRIQHNVLHHSYTNIDGADQDIDMPLVLRFSPNQDYHWWHRFQHIYAWFLYALMTLMRLFVSDFTRFKSYKDMNLITDKKVWRKELIETIAWKIFYVSYILVIPIVMNPEFAWVHFFSFLLMQFICGFILAVIFQAAHVMPSCEFPLPNEEGKVENSWAVHELLTTTNFSPNSRWFSWVIGGLNYQVEHHLFSNISHVYYRDLSPIVRQTAEEFGLPYKSEKSFFSAIVNHWRMLRDLGQGKYMPASSAA